MNTYQVVAKRWANGWELHINDVGVTQTKSLARAKRDARDYVSMTEGIDETEIDVVVTPQLDDSLDRKVRAAREAVTNLAQQQRTAADASRDIVRHLSKAGFTGADIAAILGLSAQRISQLAGKGVSELTH